MVERRHHELLGRSDILMVDAADGVLMGEDPTALPYVGVPLLAQDGDVVGALHAWGGARLPTEAHRRVLQVAATRIGTEIRLHDQQRRLEEMVETRTADLTALLERLRGVNNQLVEASRETIMRLARAAEYRDGDTGEHVDRMSSYCQVIARRMGMSADEIALIKLAAPMHDVGKIGIPDAILLKNGKLTPEEYEVMKQHPLIGARILSGSNSQLLRMAEQIAATHHEKWDGSGYPLGLGGNEIPLAGRIVALADVFDALTSPRVYKDAWSIDESVAYVRGLSGSHFDPRVVEAFMACLDELLDIRAGYVGRESEPLSAAEVLRVTSPGEAAA
ncbi:MAG: HD domain-containing protein [Deltaproteobacteria bacterium]|nr:HD domain-containing protein [Deltaproteobacteria bacterium]